MVIRPQIEIIAAAVLQTTSGKKWFRLRPDGDSISLLDRIEEIAIPIIQPILNEQLRHDRDEQERCEKPDAPSGCASPESGSALPEAPDKAPFVPCGIGVASHSMARSARPPRVVAHP